VDFALTEEQKALVDMVRDLAAKRLAPTAARWDAEDLFPRENVEVLAKAGLLGLTLPPEYGGGGASILDLTLVTEEISKVCPASAFLLHTQTGLGARAIEIHGTEEQRKELLPQFCTGEKIIAWAMSEASGGSDLGGIRTNAERSGEGYTIRGEKTWISLAGAADLFVLITRFNNEPGLAGLGAVLLPRDIPGVDVSSTIKTLGIRGTAMATVYLENCWVPESAVLLPAGSFKALLEIMNGERVAANPPISLGIAGAALDAATSYLRTREAYGRPLADLQGLRWKIADMAVALESARLLVYRAAANAGSGLPSAFEASVAKIAANESAVAVADAALQLHGAAGYTPEYRVERMVRDARGMCIGDGTVEVQRNMVANALLGPVSRK